MQTSAVEIDAGYWDRQLPSDVLAKLAANGTTFERSRGDRESTLDSAAALTPVTRLFDALSGYEVLLVASMTTNPDVVMGLLNDDSWDLRRMKLSHLKEWRGPTYLPLERDRSFEPKGPVSTYLPQPEADDE